MVWVPGAQEIGVKGVGAASGVVYGAGRSHEGLPEHLSRRPFAKRRWGLCLGND